jgi:beta-glucanase (GH16 family)
VNAHLRRALVAALVLTAGCSSAGGFAPGGSRIAQTPARPGAVRARLLFHDEFNGTSLNAKIWYRCYNWAYERAGCKTGPGELELYQMPDVSVSGGLLHLTARYQRATWKGKTYRFTSGMVQTGGWPGNGSTPTFSYLYGYAEVRARLPSGSVGMWPAFWLLPADNSWPPEIDIMEWQGVTPKADQVTLWWSLPNGDVSRAYDTGVNLSAGFHTYGLDWEPGYTDFYFDRKRVMHYTGPNVPHKAMFILINLAIGGWEKGQLKPPPKEFPTSYDVDYVRVWNRRPF